MTDLSRRALLALTAALGAAAVTSARAATPALSEGESETNARARAENMLCMMVWSGSLITTVQEKPGDPFQAELDAMVDKGWFAKTRRRNPPREFGGSRLEINGRPQPGSFVIQMDDGYTLAYRTTVAGKIEGHARSFADPMMASTWREHAAAMTRALDLNAISHAELINFPLQSRCLHRICDASVVWYADEDAQLEGWELMAAGLLRPSGLITGRSRAADPTKALVIWSPTDYGRMSIQGSRA